MQLVRVQPRFRGERHGPLDRVEENEVGDNRALKHRDRRPLEDDFIAR